jgi:aryl-alcohol dehydrogenase-like predicted oxidoreductase
MPHAQFGKTGSAVPRLSSGAVTSGDRDRRGFRSDARAQEARETAARAIAEGWPPPGSGRDGGR